MRWSPTTNISGDNEWSCKSSYYSSCYNYLFSVSTLSCAFFPPSVFPGLIFLFLIQVFFTKWERWDDAKCQVKMRAAKGRRLQKLLMPAAPAFLIQMVPDREQEGDLNMLSCSESSEDLNAVKATWSCCLWGGKKTTKFFAPTQSLTHTILQVEFSFLLLNCTLSYVKYLNP